MGILPALESRPRLVLPDTPPELVSSGGSSFSSTSSIPVDQTWTSPLTTSPSMSKYARPVKVDMPSTQNNDGGHSRPDSTSQASSRQQLPSLSSLFGPPPSTTRPLHSPVSERNPSYSGSATSPMDRPRVHSGDRQHPASYFSQTLSPPISQPRSTYDAKFDSVRQPLHTLSRSYSGPGSPRHREGEQMRPSSRTEGHVGSWSAQQDSNSNPREYSIGSRDSSFQSPRNQFRLHFPGSKDHSAPSYLDQGPPQAPVLSTNSSSTTTTTTTTNSEGVSSKDGLGPKIWTGTHFLPRFVRTAEVPGEGTCYFYDDGSHCKTVIDGEAVNAHWGVTKAGKPRKRLAIACVTCREKKIKCDPDYPRCVQCEKFGRVCKFKNAPRGGHNTSPSTPPAELDDHRKLGGSTRSNEGRMSESEASSPVSPRTTVRPPSPDVGPHKRLRVGYDSYVPTGETAAPAMPVEPLRPQLPIRQPVPELPRISEEILNRAWRTDPCLSDLHSIQTVMSHFFLHLDSTMIIRFVPEDLFKNWLSSPAHRKSPEDLMLLYSMLAVGVALSGGPKPIAFEYASVAHYAQKMTSTNCLQLAQSRILLALYYISISRISEASEMISAAAAISASLQLNVELEESREANLVTFPLGMSKAGYREARRRTFWSLFMLERLDGHFPNRVAMLNAEDIYTRLPADSHSFEREADGFAPMFNPYLSNLGSTQQREFGLATYLVEMVHIWSSDICRLYRLARRPAFTPVDSEALRRIFERIQEWHNALPSRLLFTPANLESAALAGELGHFLTMHLLYNHAMVKLSRHTVTNERAPGQKSPVHVRTCLEHAAKILDMVKALVRLHRGGQTVLTAPASVVATSVTEAVDVLTAGGWLSDLGDVMDNVRVALGVVEAMSSIWEDSRGAREMVNGRLGMLHRIRDRGNRPMSPGEGFRVMYGGEGSEDDRALRWQISNPMEKLYPREMDNIYSGRA